MTGGGPNQDQKPRHIAWALGYSFLHQFPLPYHAKSRAQRDTAGHASAACNMSTARLVRFAQGQQANGDGDKADADEKNDHWGHGHKG
jgi:hypothetical protein